MMKFGLGYICGIAAMLFIQWFNVKPPVLQFQPIYVPWPESNGLYIAGFEYRCRVGRVTSGTVALMYPYDGALRRTNYRPDGWDGTE